MALVLYDSLRQASLGWRAAGVGLVAAGAGAVLLQAVPSLRMDLFAAGAAWLGAIFAGSGLGYYGDGWQMVVTDRSIVVTAACSGTDFFLMVAALIGWRLAGRAKSPAAAALAGLALALPLTILVNALRVVAVSQAHRWLIPLLPERYAAFAHMFTGCAVFLPALIGLNFLLETYAKRNRPAAA
jgi:exosortase/archaeosortase family protein